MNEPTTYEIVIKGRASALFLRPLLHDFTVDHTVDGVTRLTGEVRDAAHLHGVVAHLTAVNAELISIAPFTTAPTTTATTAPTAAPTTTPTTTTTGTSNHS
jgi:hypothetical protein